MSYPDNRRIYFLIGLIALIILFSVYNLYLTGYTYFEVTSKTTRHIIRFGSILAACLIGEFAFRKYIPGWLIQLWRLLYLAVGLILLAAGVYDWWAGGLPTALHNIVISLNEFLISPAPFVIILLINRWSGHARADADEKNSGKFESWK